MRFSLFVFLLFPPAILAAQDRPFVTRPAPSLAQIIALADLDGNPDVITDAEYEMIALLAQLLGAPPVQN